MGERVVGDEGGDVGELGLLGLEEFAAGGGVEEEVADGEGGPDGVAGGVNAEDVAAGDLDEGSGVFERRTVLGVLWRRAGFEGDAGDGGDRREGFATEAEGGDREEVVGGAELGGGVAFEGEQGVVAHHAVAVVGDADELASAGLDVDADACGVGVKRSSRGAP